MPTRRYAIKVNEITEPPPVGNWARRVRWMVGGTILLLAAGFLVAFFYEVKERAQMSEAHNNCRCIIVACKAYAAEHAGKYPDAQLPNAKTSNEVLRRLVQSRLLEDELFFNAPNSPFKGDNNLGEAPVCYKALEAGENHWCVVKGLIYDEDGNRALIFENPAHDYAWPPLWNPDAAGRPLPGRTWRDGKIIVGRNDGSLNDENLISPSGPRVPLTDETNAIMFPPGGNFLPVARR